MNFLRSILNPHRAKFDKLLSAYANLGRFSGAVLVAHGSQVLFQQAYGLAHHEHTALNTPQTIFRLGSLSKSFTALAVMQLQEQGKLHVSDTVAAHLPGYPHGEQITLHQLLTNTSGIPDYVATPDFARQMRLPMTVEELIALFKDRPLLWAPGFAFSYSNSGWVLLGAIIERVSGLAYGDYLHHSIFEPAGMMRSGYEEASCVMHGRAEGYVKSSGEVSRAAFVDPSTMYAAGGLYSTVGDLFRWQQAMAGHTLLSIAGYAQLVATHVQAEHGAYGYGWFSDTALGHRRQGHDGGTPGFLSIAMHYPDDKLTVIILANSEDSAIHEIEHGLAAIAFGQPYELPSRRNFVHIDSDVFAAYLGRWQTRFMGRSHVMTITQEGERLMVESQGLPKTELLPLSSTRYFARLKGEVEMEFIANGNEQAHEIHLNWSGYQLTAQRLG